MNGGPTCRSWKVCSRNRYLPRSPGYKRRLAERGRAWQPENPGRFPPAKPTPEKTQKSSPQKPPSRARLRNGLFWNNTLWSSEPRNTKRWSVPWKQCLYWSEPSLRFDGKYFPLGAWVRAWMPSRTPESGPAPRNPDMPLAPNGWVRANYALRGDGRRACPAAKRELPHFL